MCRLLSIFRASLFTGVILSFLLGDVACADKSRPEAIDFPEELPWLNVSEPLNLEQLRGKVVILDFWTYGCINCIHVLDDLRRLEEKYGNRLAVIGVHTPKFDNEKNLETLRRVVVRYDIEHPVVNDKDSQLARLYGMRAWPTQYVIDPEGRVLGKVEGEGNYDILDKVIADLIDEHADSIDGAPLPLKLEKSLFANSLLAAPGKVAVGGENVAISDTLHHRILVLDASGKIQKIFGDGKSGWVDGKEGQARFRLPQGLAFGDGVLYVADTGNHLIRAINLEAGSVSTIAGNGKMESSHRNAIFDAKAVGLRSPWALALKEGQLYIAMAGSHQIWRLDLEDKKIRPWAGSGHESIEDGEIRQAAFSQPSGLSLFKQFLYVADSEVSAVRRIDIEKERVETLVGKGLFDFGDIDGPFSNARLQHPLGVAVANENTVYIADTYNHKLKKLDLANRTVTTVAGTGRPGKGLGKATEAALNEPGGLAMLGNDVLIADTNNNRIVRYDPAEKSLSLWVGGEKK